MKQIANLNTDEICENVLEVRWGDTLTRRENIDAATADPLLILFSTLIMPWGLGKWIDVPLKFG